MTIEIHSCAGGVVEVPDLRGGRDCYGDDYDSMVITQTPPPGEEVGAGQTIINVLTEDGKGNATLCTHYLNVTADNPAPTLLCPEPITAWLVTGGYEVPDLTTEVEIIGGCTVYDDLVITQSPAAGTLITTAGVHTITVTVEDEFGHEVVCGSTTVTLRDPSLVNPVVDPPAPPVVVPTFFYTTNLLAYWPLDEGTFTTDASGNGRTLTNSGASSQIATGVECHDCFPGPIFRCGSAYFNQVNASLDRADDVALKLMGTSFTIRMMIKVVQFIGSTCFYPISKLSGGTFGFGYRLVICSGAFVQGQLVSATDSLTTPGGVVPITLNQWQQIAMTFDKDAGTMKLYVDGSLGDTRTSAGFAVGNSSTTPMRIGPWIFGASVEAYIDEVGIWTEAWDADKVLTDYRILNCL